MHISHSLKNLSHVVSHIRQWDVFILLFVVLNDFFKISLAVFEYEILSGFSLFIFGVVDVEHFDDIATLS